MADDDIKFETRFSRSRGLFPYVAGILGVTVVVLAFMYLTGIGRDRLPYSDYFKVRAPSAADGSESQEVGAALIQRDRPDGSRAPRRGSQEL